MSLSRLYLLFLLVLSGADSLWAASLQLDGDFVQGGLVYGHTHPGAKVALGGRSVRVSDEGLFIIGFDRDANPQLELTVDLPDGTRARRQLSVAPRDYDIQRITGLPQRKVNPPAQALERIRREAAMIQKARQQNDSRTDFLSGFVWPLKGKITGVYGSQRILNGEPRRPHYGVDIAAPKGTSVHAPADGVVTFVNPDMYFSGGTLVLDHGHGLSSSFLHLSKILVEEGQKIRQNQIIAQVGATGRVTGPHLDWRMNLMQAHVDPQLLVDPQSLP